MRLVCTPSSARRIARNRTHFRHVSRRYAALRTFHGSSVDRTVEALASLERPITLLDVGVGTGRYLLPNFPAAQAERAGIGLCRRCRCGVGDARKADGADRRHEPPYGHRGRWTPTSRTGRYNRRATLLQRDTPLRAAPFPCREAARVLLPGRRLLLYTRTPEQNRRTIWGRLFPLFAEKEKRLYSAEEIRAALEPPSQFHLLEIAGVRHVEHSSAQRLHEQARLRHYSTFHFYTPEEFRRALQVFQHRLEAELDGDGTIEFTHENTWVAAERL